MSLSLSARLAPQFTSKVRDRGQEYYSREQVRIERASGTELHARVRGSQTYDVELNFRNGILSVWCDCPFFVDNGVPCKHLWATILAAEAQGGLSAATSAPQLVLSDDFELPIDDPDLKTLAARWRDSRAADCASGWNLVIAKRRQLDAPQAARDEAQPDSASPRNRRPTSTVDARWNTDVRLWIPGSL